MRLPKGAILVELMISILLMGIAAAAMVGVLLQGSGQSARLEHKEQATLQANQVLQALKNYVTADASAGTQASAPDGCWDFRNPPVTGPCPGTYALSLGRHDVRFLLSGDLALPAYKPKFFYDVTATSNGRPDVQVTLDWTEPE